MKLLLVHVLICVDSRRNNMTIINNFLEINFFGEPEEAEQLTETEMLNIVKEVLKETEKELKNAFLNITWCTRAEILDLNKSTRNENHATNVLSYQPKSQSLFLEKVKQYNGKYYFGDICICEEIVREECEKLQCGFKERMYVLFIHAIEHLLGYNHDDDEESKVFEDIQKKVLLTFGYKDCYLYNAYEVIEE